MNAASRPGQFRDRRHAGRWLARSLDAYANRGDVTVLALPCGGVPVACEVAHALNAPLDVFVVQEFGAPGHEDVAMGTIASGGLRVFNEGVIRRYAISADAVEAMTQREEHELDRRERLYRGGASELNLHNRVVVLVDDGMTHGGAMHTAILALRDQHPARIVVAVPTASSGVCEALSSQADEVVCATPLTAFHSVDAWYADFRPTSDLEVSKLLNEASHALHSTRH
jgi:putative phosphoribosyl transferase